MTSPSTGVRAMLLSALSFSVMTALVKLAGERLPSQEIVLARAVFTLFVSYAILRAASIPPWGERRGLLLLRGGLGFLGLSCVFYSVTHLPLAEATLIQYLHPVFTAALAAAALREAVGLRVAGALLLSLGGVAFIAGVGAPVTPLQPLAVGVAVAGALFSAGAYVVVRRLARTEHSLVIVFYFPLVAVPASVPTVVPVWVWPEGWEWLLLAGVGVAAQLGQIFLTEGLKREPAARATALSYLQIVFAAGWGALLFGERPGLRTLAGAALILVGSAIAVSGRRGPQRRAMVEE